MFLLIRAFLKQNSSQKKKIVTFSSIRIGRTVLKVENGVDYKGAVLLFIVDLIKEINILHYCSQIIK